MALTSQVGPAKGRATHRHDAADDRQILQELSLPDVVTEDHDGLRTLHFVRRLHGPAEQRRHAVGRCQT
jgi:hypothetical protein